MATFGSGSPDNKSIREQLEEMRKLNTSTTFYNKVIIGIAFATLIVSTTGIIITLLK